MSHSDGQVPWLARGIYQPWLVGGVYKCSTSLIYLPIISSNEMDHTRPPNSLSNLPFHPKAVGGQLLLNIIFVFCPFVQSTGQRGAHWGLQPDLELGHQPSQTRNRLHHFSSGQTWRPIGVATVQTCDAHTAHRSCSDANTLSSWELRGHKIASGNSWGHYV